MAATERDSEVAATERTPLLSESAAPKTGNAKLQPDASTPAVSKRTRRRLTLVVLIVIVVCVLVYLSAAISADAIVRRSVLFDLTNGLRGLGTCTGCIVGILGPLKALASIGDGAFTNILLDGCVRLKPEDVCRGALGTQGPIIAHSLRQMSLGGRASEALCSHIFRQCRSESIRPFVVPGMSTLAPRQPKKWVSKGRKPFQIVHISDLHIDPLYAIGSERACGRPLCCRTASSGLDGLPFGERGCDSPLPLFESMLNAINQIAPDAAMAVLTGDIVDHAVWLSTEKDTVDAVRQAYTLLQDRLKFPVYGAIGNHDTAPTNSFPRDTTSTMMTSDWVMRLHADVWRPYIGPRAARDLVEHWSGSFSVKDHRTGVRLININTNYAYSANFWLYDSDRWQPDPNGLLEWMSNELQAAEDAGERVYIIGHIPPSGTQRDYSAYFGQIVERYANTIAFQMFGHSHRCEFAIAYLDWKNRTADNAISVTHVGPGLTPDSGNPGFMVYDVDPDTYELLEAKHYWTNLTAEGYQDGPVWSEYFSARNDYAPLLQGPPLKPHEALTPAYWHRVTEALERNTTAFLEFHKRMTTGWQGPRAKPCVGLCKDRWINQLRSASAAYLHEKPPDPETGVPQEPDKDEHDDEEGGIEALCKSEATLNSKDLGTLLRIAAERARTSGYA